MFKSEKGMGLVELMVSVAVLGIVVSTATTYFANTSRTSKVEYYKEIQQKLAREIEVALNNPDAIKNSVEFGSNAELRNCVKVGATCIKTKPPGAFFTLLDALATAEPLAGNTVGYDIDGRRCTIGTRKCIFNPVVKFWATCDLDASGIPKATCTKAGFLNFKYQINVIHEQYKRRMTSFPEKNNVTSGSLRNVVRVRITDLLVRSDSECGPNEMLKGINAQGVPICECMVQKTTQVGNTLKPVFEGGKPACGQQECPPNTLMTGYQEITTTVNGKAYKSVVPRCRGEAECSVASPPADCPCKTITLTPTTGDCGPGFWMVSLEHGGCQATTEKGGKGAPETVKCASKTARCCSFEQQ